jgi:hypothetical protein
VPPPRRCAISHSSAVIRRNTRECRGGQEPTNTPACGRKSGSRADGRESLLDGGRPGWPSQQVALADLAAELDQLSAMPLRPVPKSSIANPTPSSGSACRSDRTFGAASPNCARPHAPWRHAVRSTQAPRLTMRSRCSATSKPPRVSRWQARRAAGWPGSTGWRVADGRTSSPGLRCNPGCRAAAPGGGLRSPPPRP